MSTPTVRFTIFCLNFSPNTRLRIPHEPPFCDMFPYTANLGLVTPPKLLFVLHRRRSIRLEITSGFTCSAVVLPVPLSRDDHGHHLVGTRPNGREPQIPHGALKGIHICISDTPHDLHSLVDCLLTGLSHELLGLRHHPADTMRMHSSIYRPRSSVDHGPRGVEQRDCICYLEADTLELVDGVPKGLTSRRIRRCDLHCGPRRSHRHGRRSQTLGNHHCVENGVGTVHFPQNILARDFDIPEGEAARTPTPATHQAVYVLCADPRPTINQKAGEGLLGFGVGIGKGVDHEVVGTLGTDDEALLTIDQEMVTSILRGGGCAEEV